MGVVLLLLALFAGAAQAQTAATACLDINSSVKVVLGPFTTEDGVTPVTPATVSYEVYRPKTQFGVRKQLVALTSATPGTSVAVLLPASVAMPPDATLPEFRVIVAWTWTWAGTCGGEACKGSEWRELRFCRPPQ